MLYIVHNHTTGKQATIKSIESLDAFKEQLQSGELEIIEEIDDQPFILSYDQAQTLNQCMASLWELVAYSKLPDGTALTHQELIQHLETILPQMDNALTPPTN